MIKKYLIIILSISTLNFGKTGLDNLLEQYRPTAQQITSELMCYSIDDFNQGFSQIMAILVNPEKRWFYFCDKREDFDQNKYWNQALIDCKYYEKWLNKLYIDPITGAIFSKNEIKDSRQDYVSLLDYWHENAEEEKIKEALIYYYLFYAFYFDCLSHFYCRSIEFAYDNINNKEIWAFSLAICKILIEDILPETLKKLKNTDLYPKYQITLKQYKEIFDLLKEEKILKLWG